jgi:hypothetical protein
MARWPADKGERSGLQAEEGGTVGRRQRRGVRRARCASDRGGERPARPSREKKGRGVWAAGRLDRRRGINEERDGFLFPFSWVTGD